MKSIAIKDLSENFFEVIGKEWMLVTAGSKEHFTSQGRTNLSDVLSISCPL